MKRVKGCVWCKHMTECSVDEMLDGQEHGFKCMEEPILPRNGIGRAILAVAGFDLFILGALVYKFALWRWI